MDVLQAVLEKKSAEVAEAKRRIPLGAIREQAERVQDIRDFKKALQKPPIAIIAEITKEASSSDTLVEKYDHLEMALQFQAGGAHALSVVADTKSVQHQKSFVRDIKDLTNVPILRKDLIIDEYQVYESRVFGADALLLMVRALTKTQLSELHQCATTMGLAVLVEAQSEDEVRTANEMGADIVGINNRDQVTLAFDIEQSIRLRPLIRKGALAFSDGGIFSPIDVRTLQSAGFKAVLVGQAFIRYPDKSAGVRSIISG